MCKDNELSPINFVYQMITDIWFTKDINTAVKKIAAMSNSPVYYYEFSFDGPFGIIKRIWGAETLPGKFPFCRKQTMRRIKI
jgi:hypothetical protein